MTGSSANPRGRANASQLDGKHALQMRPTPWGLITGFKPCKLLVTDWGARLMRPSGMTWCCVFSQRQVIWSVTL